MELLIWIIAFSLIGGVLSVAIASSFLLLSSNARQHAIPYLISFAIGALLGASLLGLLPHAIDHQFAMDSHDLGLTLLIGLLGFFLLEKLLLWRHCHSHHGHEDIPELGPDHHADHAHAEGKKSTGAMILVGDGIHNFVDGVLIAAAFLTDVHLGIVTALAVAAHEIPQELGDFIILLHSGFSRGKALFFNLLSSLATVVGAVLAYFLLGDMQHILPFVLVIAASSFIYVAVADLIPGLHSKVEPKETLQQIVLIGAGVVFIYFAHSMMH